MTTQKFEEVLNDLYDAVFLGDPDLLLQYQRENGLLNDLLCEFTTQDSGDDVVEKGVIIPIRGIDRPYTVYFNVDGEAPELLKQGNQLQHKQSGYLLTVGDGDIYLYTVPYLKNFTPEAISSLKQHRKEKISLKKGLYAVTILSGFTLQSYEGADKSGKTVTVDSMDPTMEFLIESVGENAPFTADVNYDFSLSD